MNPTDNWTGEEVALWLGFRSPDQFLRNRRKLQSDFGFPPPLPGMNRLMWSAVSLAAWQITLLDDKTRACLAELGGVAPLVAGETMPIRPNGPDWDEVLAGRLNGQEARSAANTAKAATGTRQEARKGEALTGTQGEAA